MARVVVMVIGVLTSFGRQSSADRRIGRKKLALANDGRRSPIDETPLVLTPDEVPFVRAPSNAILSAACSVLVHRGGGGFRRQTRRKRLVDSQLGVPACTTEVTHPACSKQRGSRVCPK